MPTVVDLRRDEEPFYEGAITPGGPECDYWFVPGDSVNPRPGFYRRRHSEGTFERWDNGWWPIREEGASRAGLPQSDPSPSGLGSSPETTPVGPDAC
jgi:hypothetical protein